MDLSDSPGIAYGRGHKPLRVANRIPHVSSLCWDLRALSLYSTAAHPRHTSVSETKVCRGWAAALPRAPALGFLKKAGSGVFVVLAVGFRVQVVR